MKPLDLEALEGKWYIHMTNFPMWLKGDKTQPTFNYSLEKRQGKQGLRDEVQYLKNGKLRSIKGFDTVLDSSNRRFEWRGQGWMSILRSRWEILYLHKAKWGIIYFEKTLFTPAGYDVISKRKNIEEESMQAILNQLHVLEIRDLHRLDWS